MEANNGGLEIDTVPKDPIAAIMSYEDYEKGEPRDYPYSYELEKDGKLVHYFGDTHSFDPNDPEYDRLRLEFETFRNKVDSAAAVVMVEGTVKDLAEGVDPVTDGERGFITALAGQAGLPVECPEPNASDELARLRTTFNDDEIALYYFARDLNIWQKLPEKPSLSEFMKPGQQYFEDLGLDYSLDHLTQIAGSILGRAVDPSDPEWSKLADPVSQSNVTNKVARATSISRDQTVVRNIVAATRAGKSVFIVFGGTHAVMQEPALRAALS